MSVDNEHADPYQTPTPEPEEPPPHNGPTQEQLEPEDAPVEKPVILWRSLMLEQ